MKKIPVIVIALLLFFCSAAHALETALLDMHDEIAEESKKIRALLNETKDIVLISSMWDSCILTMTQLEAYFSMLGIFNAVNPQEVDKGATNYLILWLNKIKSTNDLNRKSLGSIEKKMTKGTELHIAVLKVYYKKLNDKIDLELEKISLIEESLKIKKEEVQE